MYDQGLQNDRPYIALKHDVDLQSGLVLGVKDAILERKGGVAFRQVLLYVAFISVGNGYSERAVGRNAGNMRAEPVTVL
jgi:hypothetical protein